MITVIVPVYNSEKWIDKCVKSIINQTYKNIEILLIDDGSKDNSLKIIKSYEEKDQRIRVIAKSNEGVSKTRNLGIKEAKGDYIQFVDSDDYLDENACEILRNSIENSDMAICGMRIWKNGVVLREPHAKSGHFNLKENIDTYFELRKVNLGPCNKLYKKDKISEGFREDLSLGEDTLFVLSYMKNIQTVNSVSTCLYNVCLDNNDSLNRRSKIDKIDSLISQRVTEEEFLEYVYGKGCDLTKMFDCYLLLIHAHLIEVTLYNKKILKKEILKLINDSFLMDKFEKSNPQRLDYKFFKNALQKKYIFMLSLYFNTKSILIKIKKA